MAQLGVLLVHGLSSSLASVNGLVPHLEAEGLPYRMPVLRGHGATPEALVGVRARDWMDDAGAALSDLLTEVDEAVIVGLSMGAMLTLLLAMERPQRMAGLVVLAPAMRFRDPRARFCELLSYVIRRVKIDGPEPDEGFVGTTYPWVPSKSFVELYRLGRTVEARLPEIRLPILSVGAERDGLVRPETARIIYERVSSEEKQLRMFTQSGHEMLQSREKDQVMVVVMEFVRQHMARLAAADPALHAS